MSFLYVCVVLIIFNKLLFKPTMNNSVDLFLQQGSFRSNFSRARYILSDVLHVTHFGEL